MPSWAVELGLFAGLVAAIVAGVLVLYGMGNWIFRRERFGPNPLGAGPRWLAWFEVPILAFLVAACALVMAQAANAMMTMKFVMIPSGGGIPSGEQAGRALWTMMHGMPLVGGLLVIRWVRHRGLALLLATVLVFGGIGAIGWWHIAQFQASVGDGPSWGEPNRIAIPLMAGLTLRLSLAVVAVVSALVGYALIPRGWAFFVAGIVGGQAISYLGRADLSLIDVPELTLRINTSRWTDVVGPLVANGMLLGVLWLLPRQRAALLGVAGLAEEDHAAPRRLVLRSGFVALTALAAATMVALADLEQQTASLAFSPKPALRSPAQINAWLALSENFRRSPQNSVDSRLKGLFKYDLGNSRNTPHSSGSLAVLRERFTPEVRAVVAKEEQALAPLIEDYVMAGHADYLQTVVDGKYTSPSFLHLRDVSRWLALRARLRCVDGDWKGALADTEAILRMSALDVDGPLVMQMIYAAIRGIGCQTGTVYWQAFRDNPEAMQALREVLESTSGNRSSFPVDTLRRYEPGFNRVVPLADIAMPSFLRASTLYQRNAGHFDMLRIAVALELYRHEHGAYPERLEALVPKYFAMIPPDAFDGEPLVYEVTDKALVIDTQRHRRKSPREKDLTDPLDFPFPSAPSP